jgi:hypothetical protein
MNRRTENKTEQTESRMNTDNETKQQASAVLVEFHESKDSVMRVAGILRVPTMCSKDILLQAKGDHFGQVHSDQIVLEMIRLRSLVR